MSELKPCPFCGGEAIMDYTYYEGPVASNPKCNKYGCIGFTYREFETEQEAIEAWNHRPFEAHAVEVLARTINDFSYKEGTPKESLDKWYEQDKHIYRAEARELLGINENNDKEK